MLCSEPVSAAANSRWRSSRAFIGRVRCGVGCGSGQGGGAAAVGMGGLGHQMVERSEEHTSELQSLMRISYAVFCLKKKNHHIIMIMHDIISTHHNLSDCNMILINLNCHTTYTRASTN